ncbi:response regulator transcription factor [Pseudonocardia sp.]|uniref:response regulator transcription factor n=1 Tax=Pseudonocardia sp. TaxID=60912 RepID=UPI003D12B713
MRIVIGEDEALLRRGLTHVLEHAGHEVVGTAADAAELVRHTEERDPDLVITDIRMPPGHTDEGLVAALHIHRTRPRTAIVLLSQHVQRRYALELLMERPSGIGYLLKQRIADVSTFCADLERIRAGATVLDPEVVTLVVARARHTGFDDALDRLTPRQHEVLALMASGRSNAAIARRLSITEKAVVGHVSHIYDLLGLPPDEDDHRRVLAVVRHLSRGQNRT